MDGPRELNWKIKRLKVRAPEDVEGTDCEIGRLGQGARIGRPFIVNWTVQTVESGRQSRKIGIH